MPKNSFFEKRNTHSVYCCKHLSNNLVYQMIQVYINTKTFSCQEFFKYFLTKNLKTYRQN